MTASINELCFSTIAEIIVDILTCGEAPFLFQFWLFEARVVTIGVNGQLTYFPFALVAFESENWAVTGFTCVYFILFVTTAVKVLQFSAQDMLLNKFQN
jgi:hypothetical protein